MMKVAQPLTGIESLQDAKLLQEKVNAISENFYASAKEVQAPSSVVRPFEQSQTLTVSLLDQSQSAAVDESDASVASAMED